MVPFWFKWYPWLFINSRFYIVHLWSSFNPRDALDYSTPCRSTGAGGWWKGTARAILDGRKIQINRILSPLLSWVFASVENEGHSWKKKWILVGCWRKSVCCSFSTLLSSQTNRLRKWWREKVSGSFFLFHCVQNPKTRFPFLDFPFIMRWTSVAKYLLMKSNDVEPGKGAPGVCAWQGAYINWIY